MSITAAAADADAKKLALSRREEVEVLREHCGLTGWNRIAAIGGRRDELRKSGQESGPEEVATSLETVKWGPGA